MIFFLIFNLVEDLIYINSNRIENEEFTIKKLIIIKNFGNSGLK